MSIGAGKGVKKLSVVLECFNKILTKGRSSSLHSKICVRTFKLPQGELKLNYVHLQSDLEPIS